MAAPEEENYLSVYKQFLIEFTTSVNPNDPLPVKVTGYTLDDADVEGEIIDWSLQYLNQKNCPEALAASIARSVLGEMQNVIKEDRELRSHGDEEKGAHFEPVRLMHAVITRTREVCERCLMEIECGGKGLGGLPLPPPLPGPPFVSSYAIKNHRRRMEDRHVAIEDLHSLFGIKSGNRVGYYAIFDGHHGHEAAAYSAAQLHCLLVHSKHYPQDPEAALKDAFFRADEIFIRKCASSKLLSGTTALVALVRYRESLHVAWLGDSLGILVRRGGNVTQFVNPHTADREDERARIEAEGGVVFQHFYTWRINGTLAISRAIGDPDCKPHVSAVADVVSYKLDGSEHFIILACDGLWDCVSENEAATFVYDHLRKEPENHADLSKLLVNFAKSRASNDNISVVVVLLTSVEDILASPPPPPKVLESQEEKEEESAAEASPADGLALDGGPPCHLLVNGAMDMEAATADPSSNPFAPCKGTNVEVPSPDDHSADDLMDYHHPNHHNGHSNNDIMTSSFYGNGGANGEDARHLFGDLGPETDVDLLDDDGVDACYPTEEKDMKINADKVEQYVTEDGHLEMMDRKEVDHLGMMDRKEVDHFGMMDRKEVDHFGMMDRKEVDHLGGGDYASYTLDTNPLRDDHQQVHSNPFTSDDWTRGGKIELEGMDRFGMTQFEEPPSMRQHFREDDGVMMGEQVVACKEEIAVEKGEVVEEEELEIGGGSGVEEEAYDDSEEEGEWKYVAAKPVEGGAAVPEAITPEATLPDEAPCSPALPEQEFVPTLSPGLPPRVDAVTPEEADLGESPALPPRLDAVTPEVADRGISPALSPRLDAVTPEADDRVISPEIPQRFDALTPEVAERVVSPALSPRLDAVTPEPVETGEYRTLSPAVPPRLQAATPETLEREDLSGKAAEGSDIESAEEAADENKFCLDLGFEVVQKSHVEEAVTQELDLLKKSSEIKEFEGGRQQQSVPQEVPIQEGEAAEIPIDDLEGSTMESRLNPDAAEFVPVSPTRIVAAEPFPSVGNEFDAFKKEASECPGELFEGIAAVSTPVAKDRKSLANNYFENDSIQADYQDEDSDLVLSSSFNRDVPKSPQNLFEGVTSVVETNVTEPSDYVANMNDDENKENIMQGEDKENVAQPSGTCDSYSVLNQSFEVLDERSIDSNQITDSVEALQTSENPFASEVAHGPVESDVVAETVKESSEALNQYMDEFSLQHNEPTHENVEAIQEIISGGVDIPKPVEPMDVFSMEGISQQANDIHQNHEEIERSFMNQDALLSGLSPVPTSFENDEKNEPLMQLETTPLHNIEDQVQFNMEPSQPDEQMEFSSSPILQTSSHITEDFLEKHVDSEVIPDHDTILKDLVMEEKHATLLENTEQVKSPVPEVPTDSHVESSVERIQSFGVDFNTFTPESIVMDEQVLEYEESQKFVPPSSETVSVVSPNVPVSTAEISALIEESHALSLEEKVPVVESPVLEQLKHLEVDESETTSGAPEVELGLDLVSQKSENEICTPSTENIMSPEPMEILSETKEATQDEIISPADAICKESITEVPPQPTAEDKIPEDANKTETVVAAVAAAAVVAGVGAVAATAASKSDSKPAAKKATPSDKKKMPDKSKVSAASTAATKARPSPKPMTTTGRTSTTSKAPVTSPTKPLGTTAAKPPAERKTAAPPSKSATTTKSATSAPLSSKPKTTASKPTTAPTSRVGLASKTSATTSRPASATTATKSATTSATSSKPLSSAPRPSTAPSKATEVKKTMNGEASKPSPTSSTATSRTAPRKPLAASSTAASRLTTTSTKPAPARGTSSTLKSATESLATKTKSSPVTSAVNGAPPKTSRLSTTTASKPTATAPARTRAPLSSRTTTAAATGDPKKAKESANKHISAARPTGTTAARKTAGSPATKSSVTSPANALKKGLANGTAGKKADANINSKKAVEEKVELVISHHENGIESECNDVRKELDGIVDVEEVVHEVKEQMVLIGDAIGVGEAV